jgi:ribosomal protein S28E/S33
MKCPNCRVLMRGGEAGQMTITKVRLIEDEETEELIVARRVMCAEVCGQCRKEGK